MLLKYNLGKRFPAVLNNGASPLLKEILLHYFERNNNYEEIYKTNSTCNFDREQNFTKILHEKTTADRLI